MKILMLMQWCRPEPDFKCIPMAKALIARGHQVQVLTGFPNYPGGRLYPGYTVRFLQRETIDGVPVIRVPLYPSHDSSSLRRALNYGSFALSAALIGPFVTFQPDVVYVYNPMGLPGLVLKAFKGAPFVYDIQDLWPDSLSVSGMMRLGRLADAILSGFFNYVYHQSSAIIVLSPGFKEKLQERGVPAAKIEVIYNWCNEDAVASMIDVEALFRGDFFDVIYAGNMGKSQALATVIEAAQLLEARAPHVRFTLIGGGTEKGRLQALATERGLSNVRFCPQVPPAQIGSYLARADALLVHLKKDPLFAITVPSKIQFYLAMGKPLLVGVEGDGAELVRRSGAGISFESEHAGALAGATERLSALPHDELEAMGEQARRFYAAELSLAKASARFEKIFASVRGKVDRRNPL